MPVRSISRKEFDKFKPQRSAIAEMIVEEIDWYADDDGIVIGVLARDKADKDYSVGVLGRDERGRFRAIDTEVSIETRDAARSRLIEKMEAALATGEKVFAQGD